MPQFQREHLLFTDRTQRLRYTSNSLGRSKVFPRTDIDRNQHGEQIRNEFNAAVLSFSDEQNPEFVYLVFKSATNFFLDLEKFDAKDFRLASYKRKEEVEENETVFYYEATVYLNRRAVSKFLTKIEKHLTESTPVTTNEDGTRSGGNPKNQNLISTIEEIRAATLQSFWQEPELPFPNDNEEVWWEVWFSRQPNDDLGNPISSFLSSRATANITIGNRHLKFPEHWIYLVRASASNLGRSLLYSDRLAELRKPKEAADFFTEYLSVPDQQQVIREFNSRVDFNPSIISVCLLDTGVNRGNPLLENVIPLRNLDSVNPVWGTDDTYPQGHGSQMAGLIMYGDLSDVLVSSTRIVIYHHLESIKLINLNQPHNPELYGAITQEAIARGVTLYPANKRIVCMAITSEHKEKGRPSSWSSAVDQSIYDSRSLLFFISAGNMPLEERINYPLSNDDCSVKDPSQSFNAVVVGGYTLKDSIDTIRYPNSELLSPRGGMAACNSTSIMWESDWCRKPDIVMESGNMAYQNAGTIDPDSLQLLSTSKGGVGQSPLSTFSDTSAATALASKFAAELYNSYPELWPETIRGLIVHSADWTPAMLNNRTINQLSLEDKIKLLSRVGYGVPNFQRAKFSANNSLSLIAQRELLPYRLDGSTVKSNEFHLFDLPWPREVLQELHDTPVTLKATLSYFIEPNPGNKKYELSASYRSCGLRFKMIGPNEGEQAFRGRISSAEREQGYEREGSESWILSSQVRDKGSIHKDIWEGTAADLATRNKIAVYPINGWWRTRKGLNRYTSSIKYSLILTIETPPSDSIDIYTPVYNLISTPIQINTEINP